MLSYYFYRRNYVGSIPPETEFSSFIRDKKYGVNTWTEHTKSWLLNKNNSNQIIKVFWYEEFIKDTKKNLRDLIDLIGIEIDNTALEQAINFSSKEYMRNSEIKHNSTKFSNNCKNYFVRQAKVTKGKSLTEADKKFIEDNTRDIAQMIGYKY